MSHHGLSPSSPIDEFGPATCSGQQNVCERDMGLNEHSQVRFNLVHWCPAMSLPSGTVPFAGRDKGTEQTRGKQK